MADQSGDFAIVRVGSESEQRGHWVHPEVAAQNSEKTSRVSRQSDKKTIFVFDYLPHELYFDLHWVMKEAEVQPRKGEVHPRP